MMNNDGGYSTNAITYGKWSNWESVEVYTGGKPVAGVEALIALNAGWTPIGVAATVAMMVSGNYDYLTIKYRIRYGEDPETKYVYYQRETKFYGDGKLLKQYNDEGKANGTIKSIPDFEF